MKASDYKYEPVPRNMDVVFLQVIKPPIWNYQVKKTQPHAKIPVGAITWIEKHRVNYDKNGIPRLGTSSVIIEDNRYRWNFHPECFEVLMTSSQKVK